MAVPCGCCPIGTACVLTEVLFDAPPVIITNGTGTFIGVLSRWSDGDISGPNFTGWTSPGVQFTAATSPIIDLSFVTPKSGIIGLREWNQGGGDLNDADGFLSWDATFFNGATDLGTFPMTMGNGGAPFTMMLPGGVALGPVTRVRLSNMRKLNPGAGVAPLVREVRALQVSRATSCRTADGVLHWYDTDGNSVAVADIVQCPTSGTFAGPSTPATLSNLVMNEVALGDDPGIGESMCNVIPAPTGTTGYVLAAGCYDGSAGADTMTWAGPVGSVQMEYSSQGNPAAGAALVNFQATGIPGFINWNANATPMLPGESRASLPYPGGHAVLTYIGGTGPAVGAPRFDGGGNIRLGPAAIQNFGSYTFRVDFYA